MSYIKNFLDDIETSQFIVSKLIDELKSNKFILENNTSLNDLSEYINFLYSLTRKNNSDIMNSTNLQFIIEYIHPIYDNIDRLKNSNSEGDREIYSKLFLNELSNAMFLYRNKFENVSNNRNAVNSEKFYSERISELEEREARLLNALKATTGKSEIEINNAKAEAKDAQIKILEYKRELEQLKKQDDAKETWKKNINETFNDLKTYLAPIKIESQRLNILYYIYAGLSIVSVLVIIMIECFAVKKIGFGGEYPDFKHFITIYFPVPIAALLLWGFIYQMNRAQRQLVVLAKNIHNIEYIQGLLLSINKLAPTVEDGIARINLALDKIIGNHLNQKDINSEEDIIKEEKKDSIPLEAVIKILKDLKDIEGKK